jgi:hypothetical protein
MSATATPIEDYLDTLTCRLRGPLRDRAEITAEIRDGLLEAQAANEQLGLRREAAAMQAVNEFGDPAALAAALAPELAARASRRIGKRLAASGPTVGLLWLLTAAHSHVMASMNDSRSVWFPMHLALAAMVVLAVLAIASALAITGPAGRSIAVPATYPPTAVTVSIALVVLIDLTVLGALAAATLADPRSIPWLAAAAASFASTTRLSLNLHAGRNLLAHRAAAR